MGQAVDSQMSDTAEVKPADAEMEQEYLEDEQADAVERDCKICENNKNCFANILKRNKAAEAAGMSDHRCTRCICSKARRGPYKLCTKVCHCFGKPWCRK